MGSRLEGIRSSGTSGLWREGEVSGGEVDFAYNRARLVQYGTNMFFLRSSSRKDQKIDIRMCVTFDANLTHSGAKSDIPI